MYKVLYVVYVGRGAVASLGLADRVWQIFARERITDLQSLRDLEKSDCGRTPPPFNTPPIKKHTIHTINTHTKTQ